MTDEICSMISKEITRSTAVTAELAKYASENAKDMAHKLQKFATEIEQISYDCENSKNENMASESPSELVNDETHIAGNTSDEEQSIAVERNKLTDLISTLEETKDAVSSMQDCCVESSGKANGLLKKAYQQAQDINGNTSIIWPFGGKKSIAAITTTGLKTQTSSNWFGELSTTRKDSLKGSNAIGKINHPFRRSTLSRLYGRLGEIICSEEMTYFAAGLTFGISTAYMARYITSKQTKKGIKSRINFK